MTTIKLPDVPKPTGRFEFFDVGEPFLTQEDSPRLYIKSSVTTAFNVATGLLEEFNAYDKVVMVDLTIQVSYQKDGSKVRPYSERDPK